MPAFILDSNVLIAHLRAPEDARSLQSYWGASDDLLVSVVTRMEVLAGMHQRQALRTMELLGSITSLPVTQAIADRAGRWIYQYARRGIQLTLSDVLIAATAVEHDLTLVTSNAKHFPMEELRLEMWTGRLPRA